MLLTIAGVFSKEQVREARRQLEGAEWVDGRVTAGYQAQEVKRNAQIAEGSPAHKTVGRDGVARTGAESAVYVGSAAAAGVSADVQQLCGRADVWDTCGYGDPAGCAHGTEDPDRSYRRRCF